MNVCIRLYISVYTSVYTIVPAVKTDFLYVLNSVSGYELKGFLVRCGEG